MQRLPQWKCHKTVHAAKIGAMRGNGDGTHALDLIDPSPRNGAVGASQLSVDVPAEYMAKHAPEVGGYYVVYDDGYQSYSPAKAFEDGYSLVMDEPVNERGPEA